MAREQVALLHAARARVQTGWTQRAYARDEWRRGVDPLDPEAIAWCLFGAVVAAAEGDGARMAPVLRILRRLVKAPDAEAADVTVIVTWNDQPGRTREEVLALLDDAIALAERENDHGATCDR